MQHFADTRVIEGIPHLANVLSVLPLLIAGTVGIAHCFADREGPKKYCRTGKERGVLALFFAAVIASGFGGSYFHVMPSDDRAIYDQLTTALAAAGLIAVILQSARYSRRGLVWGGLVCIIAGGIAALLDDVLFDLLRHTVSGHTLQHLLWGIGVALLARHAIKRRPLHPPPEASA